MRNQLALPDQFHLQRYPRTQDKSLRAWSAADELLIEHLNELPHQTEQTLIVNDQFGALTVCLNRWSPRYWSDSYLANQATAINLTKNCGESPLAKPLEIKFNSAGLSANELDKPIDRVIIRVPKHNSLLEYQLKQIRPLLADAALIVAAGMTKDIHNSNLKIFDSIIGTTKTSLAKKKARLIFSHLENRQPQPVKLVKYSLDQENLILVGLPGVFSREKLDIGTRVMLDYLPALEDKAKVIDLGCGNGVLGAVLAKRHPSASILLTDESALAVESARQTFHHNALTNGTFIHTDVLKDVTENNFDLVVCNPPFHQQNVQTIAIAQNMFKQAAQKLSAKGELFVVANRHLKYRSNLSRFFQQVEPVSADNKFTVWRARNPKDKN